MFQPRFRGGVPCAAAAAAAPSKAVVTSATKATTATTATPRLGRTSPSSATMMSSTSSPLRPTPHGHAASNATLQLPLPPPLASATSSAASAPAGESSNNTQRTSGGGGGGGGGSGNATTTTTATAMAPGMKALAVRPHRPSQSSKQTTTTTTTTAPTLALVPALVRPRRDPYALMQTIVIPSPSRAWRTAITQAVLRHGHVEYEIRSEFTELNPATGQATWTGTSVVRRRYRDFEALHDAMSRLASRWVVWLPALPGKHRVRSLTLKGRIDPEFVWERRVGLHAWLRFVCDHHVLRTSTALREFLWDFDTSAMSGAVGAAFHHDMSPRAEHELWARAVAVQSLEARARFGNGVVALSAMNTRIDALSAAYAGVVRSSKRCVDADARLARRRVRFGKAMVDWAVFEQREAGQALGFVEVLGRALVGEVSPASTPFFAGAAATATATAPPAASAAASSASASASAFASTSAPSTPFKETFDGSVRGGGRGAAGAGRSASEGGVARRIFGGDSGLGEDEPGGGDGGGGGNDDDDDDLPPDSPLSSRLERFAGEDFITSFSEDAEVGHGGGSGNASGNGETERAPPRGSTLGERTEVATPLALALAQQQQQQQQQLVAPLSTTRRVSSLQPNPAPTTAQSGLPPPTNASTANRPTIDLPPPGGASLDLRSLRAFHQLLVLWGDVVLPNARAARMDPRDAAEQDPMHRGRSSLPSQAPPPAPLSPPPSSARGMRVASEWTETESLRPAIMRDGALRLVHDQIMRARQEQQRWQELASALEAQVVHLSSFDALEAGTPPGVSDAMDNAGGPRLSPPPVASMLAPKPSMPPFAWGAATTSATVVPPPPLMASPPSASVAAAALDSDLARAQALFREMEGKPDAVGAGGAGVGNGGGGLTSFGASPAMGTASTAPAAAPPRFDASAAAAAAAALASAASPPPPSAVTNTSATNTTTVSATEEASHPSFERDPNVRYVNPFVESDDSVSD